MKHLSVMEWFRRFRAWQERPFHYKNKSKAEQQCVNCGTEFNDNFCPRCGQPAGSARVGWNTIRHDIMEMWNIESRSILTTLWQLLLRPGHLIDDYLNGKRQTCYPPVKMLLMVAVGISIIRSLTGVIQEPWVNDSGEEMLLFVYDRWATENEGWAYLIQGVLSILPTWLFFRNSPRHHHHSLPEGFFIQAFIGSLVLLLNTLCDFLDKWVGIFVLVYYYLIYHRVFGYGIWGTLWRTALSLIGSLLFMFTIIMVIEIVHTVSLIVLEHSQQAAFFIFSQQGIKTI